MIYVLAKGQQVYKYPYSLTDLRLQNKGVSWPKEISNEVASEFCVFPVVKTEPPLYSKMTQKLIELDPINIEGSWIQQWSIVDKTQEEVTSDSENQWIIIRNNRDYLLALSDWTQLPDVVLENKEQWIMYRKALRDITTQSDPFNIVWPSEPIQGE